MKLSLASLSLSLSLSLSSMPVSESRNALSKTPPMGWMSWELFRCKVDCDVEPDLCISQRLYQEQAKALKDGGFIAAGYTGIHADDCWESKEPPRDPKTGELIGNSTRFPDGMKALGDYIHSQGASFGLYTAESPTTCGGYPASLGHEAQDAKTFAEWGVDYIKVDGCGNPSAYANGYRDMGAGLEASGRDIVYSCSWPAYIDSGNETLKPFGTFIMDGCNLWRNWNDIQCNWESLGSIIDHWGDYGSDLAPFAGPGHWHDMDMLLIGSQCLTEDEERTQMAIWSISAAPLIMGNDLRNVSDASKAILLNKDAIKVNQDPLGQMGIRITPDTSQQVWARNLADGSVAVALYNKDSAGVLPPFDNSAKTCADSATFIHTEGRYYEACGGSSGDIGAFSKLTPAQAQAQCCGNANCAGFSIDASGDGFFKSNANCGLVSNPDYAGYTRAAAIPSSNATAEDITVKFSDINLYGSVDAYDIWAQKSVGTFQDSFTAKQVPEHGSAFLIFSKHAE